MDITNDISNDVNPLVDTVLGHVQIDTYGRFIMPADEDITTGDLNDAVTYYQQHQLPKYKRNWKYYNGKHKILEKPKKSYWKPDNRVIVNFPRKVVNDSNGFFIGHAPSINTGNSTIDNSISNWINAANFNDVASEVSKQAALFGHSYFYVYQDENSQCQVTAASPLNTFLIYDDTVAMNVKYSVQFSTDYNNNVNIVLTDNKVQRQFIVDSTSNSFLTESNTPAVNPYPIVPVIEAKENDECRSMLDDLFTIFDAIDDAMSEKANDVDYFADAYLKMVNVNASEKVAENIRDNRLISANGNGNKNPDIGFISKPSADETQENLINRLINFIYEIANVVNVNDDSFAGNPSGVALQMKFQPMKNVAATKALKFETAFRQVFECMFSTQANVPANSWQQLQINFVQNIPLNIPEWVQLYGKLSMQTWLSRFDFIDPISEMKQLDKEKQANIQMAQQAMTPLGTDTNNNDGNNGGDE